MDRISYAGDSLVTGSEIAHALLRYAEALAQAGTAATVQIPTIDQSGTVVRAEILIGPSSQLVSTPTVGTGAEILDADLVRRLQDETARLHREGAAVPRAHPGDPDQSPEWDDGE